MTKTDRKISVHASDGTKVIHLPSTCSIHRTQDGGIAIRLDKVSRKRFIKVAMALGFPARTAQGMADTVHEMGLSYTKGMFFLAGFVYKIAPNTPAYLWAKTQKDFGFSV